MTYSYLFITFAGTLPSKRSRRQNISCSACAITFICCFVMFCMLCLYAYSRSPSCIVWISSSIIAPRLFPFRVSAPPVGGAGFRLSIPRHTRRRSPYCQRGTLRYTVPTPNPPQGPRVYSLGPPHRANTPALRSKLSNSLHLVSSKQKKDLSVLLIVSSILSRPSLRGQLKLQQRQHMKLIAFWESTRYPIAIITSKL